MKQLTATNHLTGMEIIERYVDGVKYLKVTPKSVQPLIVENLKKQLDGKPVDIQFSSDGWVRIERLGEDEKLKGAAEKAMGKEIKEKNIEVNEDYVLNQEAEMLKQQGFSVKVEEV